MASAPYTIVIIGAIVASVSFMKLAIGSEHRRYVWAIQLCNAIIVFVLGRMYSPFLVSIGFGLVLCWAFIANPGLRGRAASWIAALVIIAIVLAPFVAELVGLVTPTLVGRPDGGLVLHGLAMNNPNLMLYVLCPGYILIMVGTVALVGHETRATAQQLRERFYVQAWQIRQLMPDMRRR